MLDPDTSLKIEQIVKEFKESPNFNHNDLFDVAFGHGERALREACISDDNGIDAMEDFLLRWYQTDYLDKFYRDPGFANDVLKKIAELGVI